MSIRQALEPCDSHKMFFLAWERLVESCSPRCLVERDEELLDWEALVFYFTLNLVFLCHRVRLIDC